MTAADDRNALLGRHKMHRGALLTTATFFLPFTASSFSISSPTAVHNFCHHNEDPYTTKTTTPATNTPRRTRTISSTRIFSYGKGSQIWPECNEEPILLAASFPVGEVPQAAKQLLDSSTSASTTPSSSSTPDDTSTIDALSSAASSFPTRGRKRRAAKRTLSHILKSAAQASTRRARSATTMENEYAPAIDKGPSILALSLLGTKCVDARHVAAVVGMSAYFICLASWCAAPKRDSTSYNPIVNMPSLPSKGHVPNLITNPLGASLTNSRLYRTWLRVGALLGILLPTIILTQLILGSTNQTIMQMFDWLNLSNVGEAKRLIGAPMFLLCCQALTEAVARTALLPLPIRILIPVSYNTLRLSSLQSWAFPTTAVIPKSLQALGIANLFYWYANLFLFLIPVGVIRYLRAHFFCVEATEVTVRKGGESSVGLLP